MAGTDPDLSDDQVEQLLAEAEARLSTNSQLRKKTLARQGEHATLLHTTWEPEARAAQGPSGPTTRGQDLTVRSPRIPQIKKSKVSVP